MAFGDLGTLGAVATKRGTATNTYSQFLAASVDAGDVVVVSVGFDNITGADGDNSEVTSVTDSQGNTYTKARERTNGSTGAGGGGVTESIWFSVVDIALTGDVDEFTVNFSDNVTSVGLTSRRFSIGAGNTVEVADGVDREDNGAEIGSLTISGLVSQEYLFIYGAVAETNSVTWTNTTNYTEWVAAASTGGGAGTNVALGAEHRILTGTGDTSDPSIGSTSNQRASVMVALREVAGGPPTLTADIAQTLPALTQDVTASALLEAALDSVLPGLTQAASAEALQEAVLDSVLPALTQAATGTVGAVLEASIAQTLPALTQALTAEAVIEAAVALVLPALGQDATAEALIEAVLALDLPALTQAVVAEALVEAAITQTLPALTQAAVAEIVGVLAAAVDSTLPALTQDITTEAVLEAAVAQVLPALAQDATSAAELEAAIAQVLPALTQDLTAVTTAPLEAEVAQTLPALTQDAAAFAELEVLTATMAQVLPALGQRARGARFNTGGGREGYVGWRHTENPAKVAARRNLPFKGGTLR